MLRIDIRTEDDVILTTFSSELIIDWKIKVIKIGNIYIEFESESEITNLLDKIYYDDHKYIRFFISIQGEHIKKLDKFVTYKK